MTYMNLLARIKKNIKDVQCAADIGGNLADSDVSEELAVERLSKEAYAYCEPGASQQDLDAFFDTAYFEFLHSRGLA
jgi:hypothetical protein